MALENFEQRRGVREHRHVVHEECDAGNSVVRAPLDTGQRRGEAPSGRAHLLGPEREAGPEVLLAFGGDDVHEVDQVLQHEPLRGKVGGESALHPRHEHLLGNAGCPLRGRTLIHGEQPARNLEARGGGSIAHEGQGGEREAIGKTIRGEVESGFLERMAESLERRGAPHPALERRLGEEPDERFDARGEIRRRGDGEISHQHFRIRFGRRAKAAGHAQRVGEEKARGRVIGMLAQQGLQESQRLVRARGVQAQQRAVITRAGMSGLPGKDRVAGAVRLGEAPCCDERLDVGQLGRGKWRVHRVEL
jgi:hypothetical protein